jgi:hypothetical protein
MTILSWRAYLWLRTVPYLTEYDEGNNSGIYYYRDSVEHGTCAINDMIIIAGFLQVYVLPPLDNPYTSYTLSTLYHIYPFI